MLKLTKLLSQEKYKDSNGGNLLASEIDYITTYKHVCDGFYHADCAACGNELGSRSCGWSIAGMVETCGKCGKRNLFLRNDIDWVNEQLEKASSQDCEIRTLKRQVEELEIYRDSEPAQLNKEVQTLKSKLERINRISKGL